MNPRFPFLATPVEGYPFSYRASSLILGAVVMASIIRPAWSSEWTPLGPAPISSGPYSGRVSAIAASTTDPNRWYVAGASGGVWRTDDGGDTWLALTDFLPTGAIGALAVDPDDDDVIYAGSGEANYANHSFYGLGIYKSINAGSSWTVLAAEAFGGRTFARLVVSHQNSQVLFAAVGHAGGFPARASAKGHPQSNDPVGVFRSTDGGESWTQLTNGLPAVAATDLAVDPIDANTVYAAIGDVFGNPANGVYKSADGGDSWVALNVGMPANVGRISLAVAPSDAQRLYALSTNPATSSGGGATTDNLYVSSNAGVSWTPTNPGNLQATYGWYLSTVVVHPTNPDLFFIGGLSLLRSVNAGGSYNDVTPPHVDIHALAYAAGGSLICGNDGGVHVSPDNGNSWFDHNEGLGNVQFYPGLSVNPADQNFLIGGTQDNGTNRRESNGTWTSRLGGDGGYTALHPTTPANMFAELQGTGNLYRSLNGGTSFGFSGSGISAVDRNCFLPPVAYFPDNPNGLLYATHRIYRSLNNGTNWTAISADLTGGGTAAVRALAIAPSNSQTVYAATNDGRVLVSVNGGVNWDLRLTGVPGWPRVTREIAVDPTDDQVAYLAVSQFGTDQIRRTTDRGMSWTAVDGDLPDVPVNTVAIHGEPGGQTVFLGTDAGVYYSFGGGLLWTKLGTQLPNTVVNDLVVDATNGRLIAGTMGRGAWQIDLPLFGDADGDLLVDMDDYVVFHTCYGGSSGDPGFAAPSLSCRALFDRNGDTDVDVVDFLAFVANLVGPM